MAFTNVGCISAVVAFPTQAWGAGSKTVGPVALPDKYRYGILLIDLTQITDLLCDITIAVEQSMDGGVNWNSVGGWRLSLPISGYTINGGVLMDGNGDPVRITGQSLRFPASVSLTRQLRATATLSTSATVGCTMAIW